MKTRALLPLFIIHFTLYISGGGILAAATHELPATATEAQIQAAITAAAAGDTIALATGATYTFTQPLTLKDGIILDGRGSTWDATAQTSALKLISTPALKNVTICNAIAKNIMFRFWVNGTAYSDITNITVSGIRFQDGKAEDSTATGNTASAQINTPYIQLKSGGVNIIHCTFLRTSANPGKAISLYLAQNTNISNCLFGATRPDGSDAATHGWFKTTINLANDSAAGGAVLNTRITANRIYRAAAMAEDGDNCDHGIYAHHFDNLEISGNIIDGWPATAAGGAMKIRNAQNARITDNLLIRSGILLYIYGSSNHAKYLKNILIARNTIKIAPADAGPDMYRGIGFWRDFTTTDQAEYAIRIATNTLENGCISVFMQGLHDADWNANGGGIHDNTLTGLSFLQLNPGLAQSGNTITPTASPTVAAATLLTTVPLTTAPRPTGYPLGAASPANNDHVYTANPATHTIDQLDPDTGATTTISGAPNQPGANDGLAPAARYNTPHDLAADTQGNLYVADTNNHTIRRIHIRTGQVTTLAGHPGQPGDADGPGHLATLTAPDAIQITDDGHIYIADNNASTLRHLQVAPLITTNPVATTAAPGATVTLAAEVTAAPYPAYQWHHNGTPITTATASTLTLANLTPADAGAYTLAAQNPLGTVTSAPAQLTVTAPQPPPPAPANITTGGGGGGAPSPLYLLALAALLILRRLRP